MAKLKPLDVLGKEEVRSLEEDVKERLLELAVSQTGIPRERWVIRDLLPSDLGLSTDEWKFDYTSANAYNTVIDTTVPDRKFIVIFGIAILDPAPVATVIKFKEAADIKDVIEIEDLLVKREPEGYLEEPIEYEQKDKVKIEIYATATKTGEKIVLKGYIAELKGETITV